ncbi:MULTISPECIES: acetyl-CoA C-acyltransferase family protein [Denitromonas]|uniref:Acetyl-CoA C-acyltransferase family protein n=2 Tax=Denitromonas TaxID=139331 RepID=A0A557SII6_9RHOO|nr:MULTISPECIES: acetyl-CoA C-acyltransferase family protein [Denitromonas]MCZ4303613.1 acetyl-CoA C-acyltransferase family protein [Zoogloeaceae bacterium G21618-S1]TVO58102.1 acetyl-CoA C-acyltransferase family protein [Denitromonas halophila]TVO69124.1 acetyl-CoA C-acyltransferase family protein [Denitromonas ohlonensis]TVO77224.1 acetyl-CoA C-acyltransferase family protein [Denitromonas ohlonensis]TVT49183.1 MAG: acetyl-CoA C-acyltransferase family protein [Denitromonas halophila]
MANREVVVLSAVRSPIGAFGGSLADFEASELAGIVMKESVARSGVDPQLINYVTVGNCIPTDARYAYVSRVASIQAGLPMESVAMQVSRLCSSGLQGIVTTAQNILLGDADYGIGGGVEVMSKGAYMLPALRSGARMGDTKAFDSMVAVLTDPFGVGHMGITAENLAAKHGFSREEQDAFAVESQRRAAAAQEAGYFESQIVPIVKQTRKGEVVFAADEHLKPGTTMESLAKMKPAFKKDGTVTAGNASGINDGAAFFVLADSEVAAKAGHKPIARLVSYAIAGVPNEIMGEGPIPATRLALKKGGLTLDQMDVIESNEAFAAQALTVTKVLGLDPAKTNPNGGAIALGHPVGCSGAFIATKAVYELQRTGGRYALVTMCIGGGQGIAAIFERM